MVHANIHLRLAVPEDVPVLRELINASVRGLQTHDYTPAQIEGALQTVFGVDSQLIADGTYIVAEAEADSIERTGPKNAPFERIIVQACEDAARAAGFSRYEMGATLTGAKLFGVKGYVAVKPISIPLVNGESLPVIHMEKHA